MLILEEATTLDMSALLLKAYEVADMINDSAEAADYLYWKKQVDEHPEVQRLVKLFAKKKELFEETERFGHYHPNYHEALEQVNAVQAELDRIEAVSRFKQAEERLDDLLYSVSSLIAGAVSDTIKVPSNKPISGHGCSSGGSCSGNCG